MAQAARAQGEQFLTIEAGGHTADVQRVAFSPDGQHVLSAGLDKVVRVWSASEIATQPARQVGVLRSRIDRGIEGWIYALSVNSEGLAAVGGVQREVINSGGSGEVASRGMTRFIIRVFDYKKGSVVKALPLAQSASISALAFSHAPGQAHLLFSADNNNSSRVNNGDSIVRRWDIRDAKNIEVGKHRGAIYAMAVSPDGSKIAVGDVQGGVKIWKSEGGLVSEVKLDRGVNAIAWSPDGSKIATGQADGSIKVWPADNLKTGAELSSTKSAGAVWALAFNRDSTKLAAGTRVNNDISSVSVWSSSSLGEPIRVLPLPVHFLYCIAFAPNADVLVAGGHGGFLMQWNLAEQAGIALNSAGVNQKVVSWSQDGKAIGFGPMRAPSLAYSLNEASLVDPRRVSWSDAGKQPADAEFTSNEAQTSYRLTVGGKTYTLDLDVSDWGDRITRVVPLQDGRMLVGSFFNLYLYERNLKSKIPLYGHYGEITDLAVSPNGQWLVSSSADQTVRLWNLKAQPKKIGLGATGLEPVLSLFAAEGEQWLAWTPEGYFAASTGAEKYIRLHQNPRNPREAAQAPDVLRSFRDEYRRSDVIARLVDTGSMVTAFKSAQDERRQQQIRQRQAEKLAIEQRRKEQEEAQRKLAAEIAAKKEEEARLIREQKAAEAQKAKEERESKEREERALAAKQKELEENSKKVEQRIVQAQQAPAQPEAPKPVVEKAVQDPPPNVELLSPTFQQLDNQKFKPGSEYVDKNGKLKLTVAVPNVTDLSRVSASSVLVPMSKGLESRVKRLNQFEVEVQLVAGKNVIKVFAERDEGQGKLVRGEELEIAVFYDPPVSEIRRNLYLIAIGVSQIKSAPNLELQFAHRDAMEIEKFYKSLGGPNNLFESVNSMTLLNEQATRANILKALETLQKAGPEDVVIVHISGHGDVLIDGDQRIPFFLPHDFDPSMTESTMLRWSEFLALVNKAGAQRRLLFVDACRSGKLESAAEQADDRRKKTEDLNSATQKSDLLALVSCDSNELSWESPDDQLGYFTAALLESLRTAKKDPQGRISLFDVNYKVGRIVSDKVYEQRNQSQRPRLLSVNLSAQDLTTFLQNFIVSRQGPISP